MSNVSRAVAGFGKAMQPDATPRDGVQRLLEIGGTKPSFAGTLAAEVASPGKNLGTGLGALSGKSVVRVPSITPILRAACNAVQLPATSCNTVQHFKRPDGTKPTSRNRSLSTSLNPQQLAAARLIAFGRSVSDAARELRRSRSTVWRWQHEPSFRAELQRIHERLTTSSKS